MILKKYIHITISVWTLFIFAQCQNNYTILVYKGGNAYVKHEIECLSEKHSTSNTSTNCTFFNEINKVIPKLDSIYKTHPEITNFKASTDSSNYLNLYYELSSLDSIGKFIFPLSSENLPVNNLNYLKCHYTDSLITIYRDKMTGSKNYFNNISEKTSNKHKVGKLMPFMLYFRFEKKIKSIDSNVDFVEKINDYSVSISSNVHKIDKIKDAIIINIIFE